MRLLVTVLALTFALAAATAAQVYTTPGNVPVVPGTTPTQMAPVGMAPCDAAFDACFARALFVSMDDLAALRSMGLSNADIAIAAAIAKPSGQPMGAVANQFKVTPDWQTVATYYKVDYNTLGLSQDLMNTNNDVFNAAFISGQYGLPSSDIQTLRSQGFTWGDINLIANASARTGLSLQQVATMRTQGTSWQDIAVRYNLPVSTITEPCPTRVPRLSCCAASAAGPVCTRPVPAVFYDRAGNVLLTEDEVYRYYARGNDWTSVAIAANIARATGYPIDLVLTHLRSGLTWEQVAMTYAVPPSVAFNLSTYPFARRSIYSASTEARNLKRIEYCQTMICVPAPPVFPTPSMPAATGAGAAPVVF